jgi:glucose-6-phosphate isomerase
VITARFDPADLADDWAAALDRLAADDVVRRLWDGDHTVIQEDPTECADRLGWLRALADSARAWPRWALVADEIADGAGDQEPGRFTDVVVLGMGGSSLFPEVLSRTFEPGEGFPRITVLDSTDPDAVARVTAACEPEHTVVVVASKSGSTIETRSHLEHFWARHPIGRQYVAITDPGSGLEALAGERGFRAVLHGDPEIGGRFSALSAFGMVPAALMGLDATELLDTAEEALDLLGPDTPVDEHLGAQLGALMAVAAAAGRDKLTFHLDDRIAAFGAWLEQLIAESTGKHGVGVLPVLDESPDAPDPGGRLHVLIGDTGIDPATLDGPWVELQVEEPQDLGAQVVLWEWATTVAGIVLGINPFDQPDVESAKRAARGVLTGDAAPPDTVTLDEALALLRDGDALVIGAFVDPALEPRLQAARRALGRRAGVATTLGMGPRFLHSTGQLHKGGADRHVVVQVLGTPSGDVAVPGESFTFGELIRAQADGDLAALQASGHRAVRVELAELLGVAD